MSTDISSATSYATAAQAVQRHDVRQWGDLLSDDNARVAAADVLTNTTLAALLKEASGMVEMACLRGERYTPTDLGETLSGVSKEMLVGLVCELAFWKATVRRHPDRALQPSAIWALQTLDALADGKAIFSLEEVAEAGVQDDDFMTDGDWQRLNLATDQARRYFGRRAKWQVPGPSGGD